jgi:hypothetical protein
LRRPSRLLGKSLKVFFNDKLKSNILREFDKRLQTELSMDLYSFIANVKLDEGDSFHDVVDVIFNRDGAKGLKEFLDGLVEMLKGFKEKSFNK